MLRGTSVRTGVTGRDFARGALARDNEGSKTMFGSSTPVAVHPVHRANAVLRAALLSSTSAADPSEDRPEVESLSRAIQTVMQGPVSISFPKPLAERLEALEVETPSPPLGCQCKARPSRDRIRRQVSARAAASRQAMRFRLRRTVCRRTPSSSIGTGRARVSIPMKPRPWRPRRWRGCRRSFRKFMCRRCCTNSAAGNAMQTCSSRARSRPRSCSPSGAS